MVTSWARNDGLNQAAHKNISVNAVKQTVGPDRNKRMRQLLPYHSFFFFFLFVCFVLVGKVPFFQ